MGDLTEAVVVESDIPAAFEGRDGSAVNAEDPSEGVAPAGAPEPSLWTYLGGLALACFVVQAVTGLALAFVYQPTPDHAYTSAYYISQLMPYGWLVRTVHLWGAWLLIVLTALHAIRVLVTRSFTAPRRANWLLGALASVIGLALAFTGSLLSWDGPSYWSTVAGVALLRRVPLVGEPLVRAMLGGSAVGATTLTRFYAAHVTLLPAAFAALVVTHVWLARLYHAWKAPALPDAAPLAVPASRRERRRELVVATLRSQAFVSAATALALLLCVLVALAILAPAPLGLKADPLAAPVAASPAWYLLSLRALPRLLGPGVAAAVPVLLGLLFVVVPFIDRPLSKRRDGEKLAIAIGLAAVVAAVVLTIVGAL